MKIGFFLAVVLIMTGAVTYGQWLIRPHAAWIASSAIATNSKETGFYALLEGFRPQSHVSYKVLPPQGNPLEGAGYTDEEGALRIPAIKAASSQENPLTYDISIEERPDTDPVNFTMTLNTSSGEMALMGNGFHNFGPVSIKSADHEVRTKTDWAGIFKNRGLWNLDPSKPSALEISFYDNNIEKKIGPNPKIIKVFTAPGGGDFAPGGVHGYRNLWCEKLALVGGKTVPSTCDPPAMAPHDISIGPGGAHMKKISFWLMDNYVRALIMMSEQLTAMLVKHTEVIGTLIDAKMQLETEREFQLLTAEAHKDYEPSEAMCRFGSFVKSVPQAEQKAVINKQAFNDIMMKKYLNQANTSSSEGYALDIESRIRQFREVYCDPRDNNNGLSYMCEHDQNQDLTDSKIADPVPNGIGAPKAEAERKNKDIDFTRTADFPLTLDVDFTNGIDTKDEEDVIALARNLYWPEALESTPWYELGGHDLKTYFDMRHLIAVENVAHNSFAQIVAMKSQTDSGLGAQAGWNYMKSMMREFGLADADINKYLGDYPSYYAQMEVLTKKIYQNPDFYTNLYDKPANVHRISATLDAIKVMQQRDMLESRLRQEMLTSLLVEEAIRPQLEKVDANITKEATRYH